MRKICIMYQGTDISYHCQDKNINYRGHADTDEPLEKFIYLSDDSNNLIIVHAFCPKSVKSKKHEQCSFQNYINKYNYKYDCCLAPQAKITGILSLNRAATKKKYLRLINEPYYVCGYSFYNDKMLYASMANKCDMDIVNDRNSRDAIICAICPACDEQYCLVNDSRPEIYYETGKPPRCIHLT